MKIEHITELERNYVLEALDGQFETHNNYRFVTRLERFLRKRLGLPMR